jgi:sulfur carrier protein
MAPMAAPAQVRVCVAFSPGPREVVEFDLMLGAGTCLQDALAMPSVRQALATIAHADGAVELAGDARPKAGVGVWGRKVSPRYLLREGDRIELYRPLLVDPKVARRERFNSQGARGAGLFAQRRAGAKAGY